MGLLLVASGVFHALQLPVPVAVEAAGVLTVETVETPVDQPSHAAELVALEASGVFLVVLLALADQPSQPPVAVLEASGVFLVLVEVGSHEVLVLVQTGTEMVHGQSVTVRVVLALTV